MEFLKLVRSRRSLASEIVYAVLNVALAIAVTLVVLYTGSVWLGIGLVVLSKWRVFAVRPRYWWANVQSNVVDFIVSASVVIHLSVINAALLDTDYLMLGLGAMTLFYAIWLLYIKPRSHRYMIAAQALIAVFMGVSALFAVAYSWPVMATVLAMWLIGYATARHILLSYDEEHHVTLLSLSSGLIQAEIGWVAYHWTVAYSLPIVTSLFMPQVAIISLLLGFVMYRAYDSFYHNGKVKSSDVLLPVLLAVSIILILVLAFNRVGEAI